MSDYVASPDASRALMPLIDGISDAEMRTIGLEALRRWRDRAKALPRARDAFDQYPNTEFALNAISVDIVKQLAERKGIATVDANKLKDPFVDDATLFRVWMSPFVEFVWWLVRAGIAVEHTYGLKHAFDEKGNAYPNYNNPLPVRVFPTSMRLTARGIRFLDRGEDDPLLPGFLDRIRLRCPGLPDGVLALLVDVRECLDRHLNRPALILMGVAYELAIEQVIANLITKGMVPEKTLDLEAKKRLDRVLDLLGEDAKLKLLLPESDDRRRAQMAYDFADTLRLTRNAAAHTRPAFDFDHGEETEEFLVSAGRHLPGIWLLATDPPPT